MELEYKTEEEVINFFKDRAGSREVFSICQSLINRGNIQDAEINHIRKTLHKLKVGGYLLVQNEGENIYEEKFSSTPDRIEKYFETVSESINNVKNVTTNSGIVAGGAITAGGDIFVNGTKKILSQNIHISSQKLWYEKPIGILFLMITGGLCIAGLTYYFDWN